MKKIISLILTTFTVAILFAAARPSLDGRAVVAEDGEMPKGLFARTIGYLPGDSVTVTNPANGNACDVLILGSIDASEGVAILLSPEAADRLAIRKDSNVQVKITKRTGSLDENVSGTATLSDEDDTDYNSGSLTEETAQAPEETPAPEASEAVAEETSVESGEVPADEVGAEPVEVTEADSEGLVMNADSFDNETPAEEVTAESVESAEPVEETPAEAVVVEAPAEEEKTELVAEEEIPEEEVPEELVEAEAPSLATVTPNDVVIPDNFEELANEAGKAPVQEVVSESAPEVSAEEPAEEEPAADEYAPIVLVPSEPNPPEETEVPAEVPVETPVETPVEIAASVTETAPAIEIAPVESVTSADINFENFIRPSLKDLESGKYYVQIASLGQKENVESLLAKYTPKYPVVLVPLSNGKGYQVLVGPLTADEYGMIIERFQSYGFKDCFLRKIK